VTAEPPTPGIQMPSMQASDSSQGRTGPSLRTPGPRAGMPSLPPSAPVSLDCPVNDRRRLIRAALRFDDTIEVQPSRFDTDRRDLQ
jgi:hypothetical protein